MVPFWVQGYIRDYIGDYYTDLKGDARGLDPGSYKELFGNLLNGASSMS